MALGASTAAPTGYLDFCQRQPEDCGGAPAAVIRKVAEVELARRNASEAQLILAGGRVSATAALQAQPINWTNAFAEARLRREAAARSNAAVEAAMTAALAPALSPPETVTAASLTRVSFTSTGVVPMRLVQTTEAAKTEPPVPVRSATTPVIERPALTPALWSLISRVNDKVNRDITRRSDIEMYGVLDRWATPLAAGNRFGDCEDYVLEKRRALMAAGLPASALAIAVATTSWGETHAVLLVATDKGDYVLDSLTPWILPWRKANLTWRERQAGDSPFRWALVDVAAEAVIETPTAQPVATDKVEPQPTVIEPPLRRLRTADFNARPNGVVAPVASVKTETAPEMTTGQFTLAQLGGGGPLRGRLH
jgi:predicted transglutaminase-like cysteine proteinase